LRRWAHAAPVDPRLPALSVLLDDYVGSGKLVGAVATLGWGTQAPEVVARGVGTRGDSRASMKTACSASIR
jgi:hypothetical protein